jgi:hypothetical protein
MALLQSSDVLVTIDDVVVGHSKDAVFSLEVDLANTTTKISDGWAEFMQGLRSGRISLSGLTNYSNTLNFEQIAEYILLRQVVTVYFKDFGGGDLIFGGTCFLESVTETAEYESITTFNVDLTLHNTRPFTRPVFNLIYPQQRVWNNIFEQWNLLATLWQNT